MSHKYQKANKNETMIHMVQTFTHKLTYFISIYFIFQNEPKQTINIGAWMRMVNTLFITVTRFFMLVI